MLFLASRLISAHCAGERGREAARRRSRMSENDSTASEAGANGRHNQVLTPKEQIEVILAEYSYREEEKNVGATGISNIITVAIAVLAGLLALILEAEASHLLVILPATILVFISMESDREFSVLYQAMYIGLLEERVNQLAGKPLLLWERFGSSYHTIIGKFRVEHPARHQRVTNLNSLVMLLYVLIVILLFIMGLVEGGRWLAANLPYTRTCSIVILTLYEVGHVLFLGFILFNRFVQQRRLLRLVEDKLRDEFFHE